MGQFYSKNSNDQKENYLLNKENIIMGIKLEKVEAKIENKPTVIDERSASVLKYRTPHFKFVSFRFIFKFKI